MLVIGIAAAVLTTISFIPQVYKIWKTNDTNSISLFMFILFSTGVACWLVYGILKNDIAIIAANFITLVMALYILIKKIINRI